MGWKSRGAQRLERGLKSLFLMSLLMLTGIISCQSSDDIGSTKGVPIGSENQELPSRDHVLDLLANKQYKEAVIFLEKLHAMGDKKATFILGKAYSNGWYVNTDKEKAYLLYKAAAEAGEVGAMNELATVFYYGYGVEKNLDESFFWYEKAARLGSHIAANNLAFMFLKAGDHKTAYKWLCLYVLLLEDEENKDYHRDPSYLALLNQISQEVPAENRVALMVEAAKIHLEITNSNK